MTYFKTALVSAAALAIAAPAFAGDGHMKKKHDAEMKAQTSAAMMDKKHDDKKMHDQHDSMTKENKTAVMGATEMAPSKVNDTVGEMLQADGEPSIQSDEEIIVQDYQIEDDAFRSADDDGMIADNAIAVPGSNGTVTTVTCPAGTTAQADMTCLITGDYNPDLRG